MRPGTRARRAIAPAKPKNPARVAANIFAVAVGFGTAFTVHLVGELYIAEVLLLVASIPLLLLRGRKLLNRELMRIYALMALWLLGQVISDAYNHITLADRMRGAASIIFFGIDLAALLMLLGGNEIRKRCYLVGLISGLLASVKLQPSPAIVDYPWKFGYASGTILLVMLVSSFFYDRRRYLISGLLILGISGVNLLLNFRGPVLNLLIALVLVHPIIPERFGRLQILPKSQTARVAVMILLAIGAGEVAKTLVDLVTEYGFVSEEARAKNQTQSKGGNLLLGGRPEFAIGLKAAMDRPIIGHGSWAKDPKYYEMLYDTFVESGEWEPQVGGDIISGEANPLIPGHSAIVTAWIWSGILGLIFWLYMVWLVGRGILRAAVRNPLFAPIYMYLMISMMWNAFFSPFAAIRRMTEGFTLVVILGLLKQESMRVPETLPSMRRGSIRRNLVRPITHHSAPSR
jgi:hypothetical protein